MRVLLVEDNDELRGLLIRGLESAAFLVDALATKSESAAALRTTRYSALILDLGLPDGDGLTLLRSIRERSDPLPVLILTARDSVEHRVSGLQSGADDYLIKPFAIEELIARLQALLRRPGEFLGKSLQLANLTFDTEARQAFIDGVPQILSAREMAVLEILMRRSGRVVSKKLVEDQIFGLGGDLASNAIEVYIHRLRKGLADRGARVTIHTVRGVGYLIEQEG
jgi:two-component system response regulator TctD